MEGAAEGRGGVEGVTVFCAFVFLGFFCFFVQCGCMFLKFDVHLSFGFGCSENSMMVC